MKTMLVLRQLAAVLDQKLVTVTRARKLTPHDLLVLAWMEQKPGISGSLLAHRVGRKRQNIQASLERLEQRGLAEKYAGSYRGRSVGWGLTNRGASLWAELATGFQVQEDMLASCGVTPALINALEGLITRMARSQAQPTTWSPGLIEVPEDEVPEWADSGEVELPSEGDVA
ncbi:MAG: MarR family winged helix-turn-helix transcriptional regulator [Archangium sp.]|nr:MarR family winged helix-turn-helix transcriptional regulator [Archangium sp.]